MRILLGLLVFVLLVNLPLGSAQASGIGPGRPAPATKEPERFAFVVGNAHYQRANSNLDDLPDACLEAIQFRKELLSIGWAEDHIYPLVKAPTAGETQDDAVMAAVCDMGSHELQWRLSDFVNLVLTNQNNPYGVVFYAGHGAESNDQFYGFGVDAVVDLDQELNLLQQTTDYEVFSRAPNANSEGPTGVNLTHAVAAANGPAGKALLMIVDACRDDPVLEQFIANRTDPVALSPEARRRLSIDYIASRPDKYDELFRNIMVMFAGRPDKPAQSGTAADPNWFSKNLFEYMHDPANLSASAPIFVSDFESRAKRVQGGMTVRQIPEHIGSMARTPVFCFKGCAQPLSVWTNEQTELIADNSGDRRRMAPIIHASQRLARPKAIAAALFSGVSQNLPPKSQDAIAEMSAARKLAGPRPINLDVFYCAGDPMEGDRRNAARAFAEDTRRALPRDFVLADSFIDQIRLRSLDVNVNLAMKHPKTGNSLVLVKSDPSSQEWLSRLRSGFDRAYMDDVTKGYFRAYFCAGFSPSQKPRPLVYTQVAHRAQVPPARSQIEQLSSAVPDVKFVQGVEAVDDSHPGKTHTPNQTQLRCYVSESCLKAERIAKELRSQITGPVSVVRMPPASKMAKQNPVIELWFGQSVLKSWDSAPQ